MKEKIDIIIKNIKNVKVGTWIRFVLLIVSFVNLFLAMAGKAEIKLEYENLYTILSVVFAFIIGVLNYWKNNSFTQAAQKADEYLHLQGTAEEESLLS